MALTFPLKVITCPSFRVILLITCSQLYLGASFCISEDCESAFRALVEIKFCFAFPAFVTLHFIIAKYPRFEGITCNHIAAYGTLKFAHEIPP